MVALTFARHASGAEWCTNDPGLPSGWRGCDDPMLTCAYGGNWPGSPTNCFRADYASAIEAEGYLDSLEGASDHLALIDLGESPMFDWQS
jgi:hypothetical protein